MRERDTSGPSLHRENILTAELERNVTEIIGGVKRQLAEFVQGLNTIEFCNRIISRF